MIISAPLWKRWRGTGFLANWWCSWRSSTWSSWMIAILRRELGNGYSRGTLWEGGPTRCDSMSDWLESSTSTWGRPMSISGSATLAMLWSMWLCGWKSRVGSLCLQAFGRRWSLWRCRRKCRNPRGSLQTLAWRTSLTRSLVTRPGQCPRLEVVQSVCHWPWLHLGNARLSRRRSGATWGSLRGSSFWSFGRHFVGMTPWEFPHPPLSCCVGGGSEARSSGARLLAMASALMCRTSMSPSTLGWWRLNGFRLDGTSFVKWEGTMGIKGEISFSHVLTEGCTASVARWCAMLMHYRCRGHWPMIYRRWSWVTRRSPGSWSSSRMFRDIGRSTQKESRWCHGQLHWRLTRNPDGDGVDGSLQLMKSMPKPLLPWFWRLKRKWPRNYSIAWGGADLVEDEVLLQELGKWLEERCFTEHEIDEQLRRLRQTYRGRRWRRSDDQQMLELEDGSPPGEADSPLFLADAGSSDPLPLEDAAVDLEANALEVSVGTFVLSLVGRTKRRTLHCVGSCYRKPGIHYKEFLVVGDVRPTLEVGERLCTSCFGRKDKLVAEAVSSAVAESDGQSVSSVSSSTSLESQDSDDSEWILVGLIGLHIRWSWKREISVAVSWISWKLSVFILVSEFSAVAH